MGSIPRRQMWKDFPTEQVVILISNDLDALQSRLLDHEEEDEEAFRGITKANRWILTALFVAMLQLISSLILVLLTTR